MGANCRLVTHHKSPIGLHLLPSICYNSSMPNSKNSPNDSARVRCTALVRTIDDSVIIVLPEADSALLPSRGMVMTIATIGSARFLAPLEPDGKGSHWLRPPADTLQRLQAAPVQELDLCLEVVNEWPEPEVPEDLQAVLDGSPELMELWLNTTPLARWDWIRWIRATNNPKTREKHIQVACSKLRSGMRRPCCFNRSMCTDPSVSKNGVLL